jgi:hypothetical protein
MRIKIQSVSKIPGGNASLTAQLVDATGKVISGTSFSILTKTTDASLQEINSLDLDLIHEVSIALPVPF